ncbi:MAG: sensor histidine kinase [Gemmatimonadota bacterium]
MAHDFNDIMTAIVGHAHYLIADLPPDDPLREDAEEIRRTAERSAVLTRQLLAFSRKQILRIEVVDVARLVRDTGNMQRRMIGEDVTLRIEVDAGGASVEADAGQLEQVLANMVLNARDAMPDGGEPSVRCCAGRWPAPRSGCWRPRAAPRHCESSPPARASWIWS